jgi:hypothetical protein
MSLCMGCPIHAHFAEKINILQLSKCVYHHVLLQEMACLQQPLACCKSNRIQSAGQSAMSDHLWYVMLHDVLMDMMETAQPACQADTVPSAGQARHRCMRKRQHSVALMSHSTLNNLGTGHGLQKFCSAMWSSLLGCSVRGVLCAVHCTVLVSACCMCNQINLGLPSGAEYADIARALLQQPTQFADQINKKTSFRSLTCASDPAGCKQGEMLQLSVLTDLTLLCQAGLNDHMMWPHHASMQPDLLTRNKS